MPGKRNRPKAKSAKGPSAQPLRPAESPRNVEVSLPARLHTAIARAGHIQADTDGYSPADVQVVRIAEVLYGVGVPASKIVAALGKMREVLQLGASLASSGVSQIPKVTATSIRRREALEYRREEATQHFEKGVALEDTDIDAARESYMAALASYADHLEARINLGRLLHLRGDLKEAEKIYRAARHSSAELTFNLAVLLEDLNREAEAVLAYRETLALDPAFHDAHYNLSRLHEQANRPQDAFRHLLAYQRHMRNRGG